MSPISVKCVQWNAVDISSVYDISEYLSPYMRQVKYCIAGIYNESFNFANFANRKALAKLAYIFGSILFCPD